VFTDILGDDPGPNRGARRHPDSPEALAYTAEVAGQLLGLGRTTTYAELRSGRLRSFKVGKRRLVPAMALPEYIADRLAEEEAS
jgi:excisionase family DNA binding protein